MEKSKFILKTYFELNNEGNIRKFILSKDRKRSRSLFKTIKQGTLTLEISQISNEKKYNIIDISNYFVLLSALPKYTIINKDLNSLLKENSNDLLAAISSHLDDKYKNSKVYHLNSTNKYVEINSHHLNPNEIMVSISDITANYKDLIHQRKQTWELVTAMGSLVEKRDLYTSDHQKKVAILSAQIAAELNLNKHVIESVFISGMLHDIGKVSIPTEILNKPSKLLELEFGLVQTHVDTASEILSNISFDWPITEIVSQHHESLDGSGYPLGLTDKDICLEAKILAVADAYDAITSHRPYRPSLGADFAENYLLNLAEKKYDSSIVHACIKVTKNTLWNNCKIENILGLNYFSSN